MNRARAQIFLSYFFQIALIGLVVVSLVVGDMYSAISSVFGFILISIPALLRRERVVVLPFELNLWIFLSIFLHNFGLLLHFYDILWWWDKVTHFLSTSLIAAFGFIGIVIVDKYAKTIDIPVKFLPFFIVVFVMAMGVLWEIIEFAFDQTLGTGMQYSLSDTVTDLVFDLVGGLAVGAVGPIYLKYRTVDALIQELKVEGTVKKMKARRQKG